jgi:hypothetical protein
MRRDRFCTTVILSLVLAAARPIGQRAAPQSLSSVAARRVAILAAEDRRAPTARDLATIRAGVHSGDATTVRIAIRTARAHRRHHAGLEASVA